MVCWKLHVLVPVVYSLSEKSTNSPRYGMETLHSSMAKWAERNNESGEEVLEIASFSGYWCPRKRYSKVRAQVPCKYWHAFRVCSLYQTCRRDLSYPKGSTCAMAVPESFSGTFTDGRSIAEQGRSHSSMIPSFPAVSVDEPRLFRKEDCIDDLKQEDEKQLQNGKLYVPDSCFFLFTSAQAARIN